MGTQDSDPPATAPTAEEQVARIFAWRRGFNAMHLIDLGVRLGLFKALAANPGQSGAELAGTLGLHAPYVQTWCTTAFSLELLEADDDSPGSRFRLAPHVDAILGNEAHPRYLGGYVRLGTEFATDDCRLARRAFATGEVAPYQGRSDDFTTAVTQVIAGVNVMVARKILPGVAGVADVLNAGGSLLEVGCGTGFLQLQLAKAFPHARCTGVDIDPIGLGAARRAVEDAGLEARVRILEGDVGTVVAPDSFGRRRDGRGAARNRPRDARRSGQKLRASAQIGGRLDIVDETYPSSLTQARQPDYRFPLQTGFEELMWGNVVPTREEQERLLAEAGFGEALQRSLFGEGIHAAGGAQGRLNPEPRSDVDVRKMGPPRYFDPLSHPDVTTRVPGPSSTASSIAATTFNPVDPPAKMPASRASRRHISKALSWSIARMS